MSKDNWQDGLTAELRSQIQRSADDIFALIQNMDIGLNARKKNNILIIQNVNVKQEGDVVPIDPDDLYLQIIKEIIKVGGIKTFLKIVYDRFISHCGTKAAASRQLGVSLRSLYNYKKKGAE